MQRGMRPGLPFVERSLEVGHPHIVGRVHARFQKKGEVEIGSYGSAQLIYRVEGGYVGGSEPRRDGQAVGF